MPSSLLSASLLYGCKPSADSAAVESCSPKPAPAPAPKHRVWRRAPPSTTVKEPVGIPIPGARKWQDDLQMDARKLLPAGWEPKGSRIHNRKDDITDYYAMGESSWGQYHAQRVRQGEREIGTIRAGAARPPPGFSWPASDPVKRKNVAIVPKYVRPEDNIRERNSRRWAVKCKLAGVAGEMVAEPAGLSEETTSDESVGTSEGDWVTVRGEDCVETDEQGGSDEKEEKKVCDLGYGSCGWC